MGSPLSHLCTMSHLFIAPFYPTDLLFIGCPCSNDKPLCVEWMFAKWTSTPSYGMLCLVFSAMCTVVVFLISVNLTTTTSAPSHKAGCMDWTPCSNCKDVLPCVYLAFGALECVALATQAYPNSNGAILKGHSYVKRYSVQLVAFITCPGFDAHGFDWAANGRSESEGIVDLAWSQLARLSVGWFVVLASRREERSAGTQAAANECSLSCCRNWMLPTCVNKRCLLFLSVLLLLLLGFGAFSRLRSGVSNLSKTGCPSLKFLPEIC